MQFSRYFISLKMLNFQNPSMKFTMASGYFNCLEEYEDLMTNKGKYDLDILVASPKVSSSKFYVF